MATKGFVKPKSCLRGHHALCARCAKSGLLWTISPDGLGDSVTTVFSFTGLLRFLLSSKTQIMSQNKLYSPPKMPEYCLNLLFGLVDTAPPVAGGFKGGHGKVYLHLGAVPTLCRNAP